MFQRIFGEDIESNTSALGTTYGTQAGRYRRYMYLRYMYFGNCNQREPGEH